MIIRFNSEVWIFSLKVGRVDMFSSKPDVLLDLKNSVHIADIKVTLSLKNNQW